MTHVIKNIELYDNGTNMVQISWADNRGRYHFVTAYNSSYSAEDMTRYKDVLFRLIEALQETDNE